MEELLEKLEAACAAYYSKELDDVGFQNVIDTIPAELWQEKESALTIVKSLVENEDLYEVSFDTPWIYSEFICRMLPRSIFENPDYVLGIAEIIYDFFGEFDEGPSGGDMGKVFSFAPQTVWEDDEFANDAANFVIDRIHTFFDLCCISDVIPDSVWKNENELSWLVRRLYNVDERNMSNLSLFPEMCWESATVIFEILSCLQEALENDRAWGTVYCNFRGSNEVYLEDFLSYVPDKFKTDKDFIQELLGYDYFSEAFHSVYEWMDQAIWSDKEFVLEVLEKDVQAVIKVSEQLATDPEFRAYIDENIDFEWDLMGIPQEKIPQWIKDLKN